MTPVCYCSCVASLYSSNHHGGGGGGHSVEGVENRSTALEVSEYTRNNYGSRLIVFFQATLRMDKTISIREKKQRVAKVMKEVRSCKIHIRAFANM